MRAYHGVLQAKHIQPKLPLEKDLELTDQAMSYESGRRSGAVPIRNNPLAGAVAGQAPGVEPPSRADVQWPVLPNGTPDFENMNPQQRRAYDQHRLTHRFG